MKTIKQIADEIGVSKQAVYKRYKGKLNSVCAPYAHTEHGVLFLSDKAEIIIKDDFLKTSVSTKEYTECSSASVVNAEENNEVITILQKTIDTLQSQLEVKDNQIEKLTEALILSQKAATTAQALHAGTMQKQLQESEIEKEEIEIIEEKQGFWKRIFSKKE